MSSFDMEEFMPTDILHIYTTVIPKDDLSYFFF